MEMYLAELIRNNMSGFGENGYFETPVTYMLQKHISRDGVPKLADNFSEQ